MMIMLLKKFIIIINYEIFYHLFLLSKNAKTLDQILDSIW